MSGNSDLLKGIVGEITSKETTEPRKRPGYMSQRSTTLSDIASGSIEDKAFLWVDPESCCLWEHHNRRYDLLSETKCSDLIEGIKSQGRQEIPAIVRTISDKSGVRYEIIAGARRHWAISWLRKNNYPNFQYLIEVRDLTDEQAFRLSDMENRDRDDISDYERAMDYKKAINLYYGGVASRMAERIGYTNANLTYLLKLADLPEEIVGAFLDITEITVNNGRQLAPVLKDRNKRQRLLSKAKELAVEQASRNEEQKPLITGKEIMSLLLASTKQSTKKSCHRVYKDNSGKLLIEVMGDTKKEVNIKLNKNIPIEQIRATMEEFLADYYSD